MRRLLKTQGTWQGRETTRHRGVVLAAVLAFSLIGIALAVAGTQVIGPPDDPYVVDTTAVQSLSLSVETAQSSVVTNPVSSVNVGQIDPTLFPKICTYVDALDASGMPIPNLPADSFCVSQDSIRLNSFTIQQIRSDSCRVTVCLVIDVSGSMSDGSPTKISSAKSAAARFVRAMKIFDRTAIVKFSSCYTVVQNFTSDTTVLLSAINGLSASGTTAFFDGEWAGVGLTTTELGSKSVIALTDGMENNSQNCPTPNGSTPNGLPDGFANDSALIVNLALGAGIPIYNISLGSSFDPQYLIKLSNPTGGAHFHAPTGTQLDSIYDAIRVRLCSRYLICYNSPDTIQNGDCHKVIVCHRYGGVTCSPCDTGAYCEKFPPKIKRTPPTIALDNTCQRWGTAVQLCAWVTDQDTPLNQLTVNMFYRNSSAVSYTQVATTRTDSTFCATVPANQLLCGGDSIQYYFTASDGSQTVASPSNAPVGHHAFPICVNHAPVCSVPNDTTITQCAYAQICLPASGTDQDGNLQSCSKTAGSGSYNGTTHLWCYTPTTNSTVSATFRCTDSCGLYCEKTFNVTISLNSSPVCSVPKDTTIFQCAAAQVCLPVSATDVNNNLTGCAVTAGSGTITNGNWCYTPTGSQTVNVTVRCTDACGAYCEKTFHVTFVINSAPVCSVPNDTTIFQCTAAQVCLPVSATDVNNNLTGCTVTSGPGSIVGGNWCYTPTGPQTATVTVRCTDACEAYCEKTFHVTFTLNHPPTIAFGNDFSVPLGASPSPICVTYTDSDPDSPTGLIETIVTAPAGATLDTLLNKICFTPVTSGVYPIIAQVKDPCNATDVDTIIVSVFQPAPPECRLPGDTSVLQCAPTQICLPVTATSLYPPVVCAVIAGPGAVSNGQWCYTPTGDVTAHVTIRCTDSLGAVCTDSFKVVVDINDPPSIAFGKDTTVYQCATDRVCVGYTVNDVNTTRQLTETLVSGPSGATIDTLLNKVCFTPEGGGLYTIIGKVTDSCGTSGYDTIAVTVDVTKPVLTCSGDTLTCDSTLATASVSSTPSTGVSYLWTPAPASGQGTRYARYNSPGSKKVVVTITATGCKDSCDATITQINTKPVLGCTGDTITCVNPQATASVTSNPSVGVSYLWTPAPLSGQGTPNAVYSTAGTKKVVVKILATGCKDSCNAVIIEHLTNPVLTCKGDTITCDHPEAIASVTSNPSDGVSYLWSPAPLSGQGTPNAHYTTPGTKKVVVTIVPAPGKTECPTACKDSCYAVIIQNTTKPVLNCSGDALTCDSLLATASVNSTPSTGVNYLWSPAPVSGQGTAYARYDTPGTKKVVVTITATGCKDSCDATITQDLTKPQLTCAGDTLTCDSTQGTASVSIAGDLKSPVPYSFVWTPSPLSGQGTPFARYDTPGPKKVVVTYLATGCKDSCEATITQTITKPVLSCSGDDLTCDSTLATASVTSTPSTGVTYLWSPAPVSGQGTAFARYDTPGSKHVVVTIIATGCKDSCDATINQNVRQPELSCDADTITCLNPHATARVTSSPNEGISYFWDPAPDSGQGTAHAHYDTPGTKHVIVTILGTGCKDTCTVDIQQNLTMPKLTCTGDTLTCDSLEATASVSYQFEPLKIPFPLTFVWSPAPLSGQGTPFARYDTPGIKKVVVTYGPSGCKDSCEATITQITTKPSLSCSGDELTCDSTLATASVTSTPSTGVSYLWSPAPVSGQGTAFARYDAPGSKWVVVTIAATGCKDSCEATITQNIQKPQLSCTGDTLTCDSLLATASVSLPSGAKVTDGWIYLWTPAPVSGQGTPVARYDAPGTKWVVVTIPETGCKDSCNATIIQINTKPDLSCAGDELTCDSTLATASVTSTPSTGVSYVWSPSPVSGQGTAFARYNSQGPKKVVVTLLATGCKDSCEATITQNLQKPFLICTGDTLTCDSLLATASVGFDDKTDKTELSVYAYLWSPTPVSGQGTPFARYDSAGQKKVVVTYLPTGCKDSCEATITQIIAKPSLSCSGDELTCDSTLATASVTSTPSTGVSYLWTPAPVSGQGTAFARYDAQGAKKVVVTITATGCKDSCDATITQNLEKPLLTCAGDTLTCDSTQATASVSIDNENLKSPVLWTFVWTPAPLSGQGTPFARYDTPGTKKVVVTYVLTGCKDSCNAIITQIDTKPALSCSGDELTCDSTQATASVTSTPSTGVSYLWTPAPVSGQGTAFARYDTPGSKWVVVTILATGCKDSCDATITQNLAKPEVSCNGDELTCDSTQATASVSIGTEASKTDIIQYAFVWTPAPVSGQGTPWARYDTPGLKTVVVTYLPTGCKDTCNATITQDLTKPELTCSGDTLTCDSTQATASVNAQIPGLKSPEPVPMGYLWTPTPLSGQGTPWARYDTPGTKKVVVTYLPTGCKDSCNATITQSSTKPELSCKGDTITCNAPTATVSVISSPSEGVSYHWSPTPDAGQGTSAAQYTSPGTKKVVVTLLATGCKDSCEAVVDQDNVKPTLECSGDELTCDSLQATASVFSNPSVGVTYAWTPAPVSGQGTAYARYDAPGTKTVVVTITASGCRDSCHALITQDVTPPNVSAGPDTIINCLSTQVNLSGYSSTPSAIYSWVASNGGHIVSGANGPSPLVDAAGTYTLTVTNPANGCKASDFTVVTFQTIPGPECHLPNDTTIFQCVPAGVQLPVWATFYAQVPDAGSKRRTTDGYSRGKRTDQMGAPGSMAASAEQQGCAIVSGPGTLINGLWTYTPTGSGSVTVTVRCTDECGQFCEGTFTVNFNFNHPPTISLGIDRTATLGDPPVCFTYTVSDPEGLAGLTESLVSFPAGTTIDTALNRICWTPSGAGVFLIVGKVQDPCRATDLDTMAISVSEPAPPICSIPNDTAIVQCGQTPLCLPVHATSLYPPVNCAVISGPGTVSDGNWCYTPTGNETVHVTIQCTDQRGSICSGQFQVVFDTNAAPVCHIPNDTTIFQCVPAPVRLPFSASDPDNNLIGCVITSGPGKLTTSGTWAYTPRGADTVNVTIRCTDACSLYCEKSFRVAFAIDHLRPICKPTVDTTIHACPSVPILIPIYADLVGLVDCYISGGPGDLVNGYWVYTPTAEQTVSTTIRCHSVCNESWQWSLTIHIKLDGTNCGGETVSLSQPGTGPSPTAAVTDPCNCPARGDIDGNGEVNVHDLALLTGLVFRKVPPPALASGCSSIKQCDVNCDGVVDRRDVLALAAYAFDQGPQLCEPCSAKNSGANGQPKR